MEIGNNEIRILEEILTKSVVAGMEAAFDRLDGWASERKEARQALRAKADEMSKESRAVIRKEYVFSLGFENSRIVITLSRLGLVLLLSLVGNFWQMRQNSQLPGNDLIYRHVRMCGEANREKQWTWRYSSPMRGAKRRLYLSEGERRLTSDWLKNQKKR